MCRDRQPSRVCLSSSCRSDQAVHPDARSPAPVRTHVRCHLRMRGVMRHSRRQVLRHGNRTHQQYRLNPLDCIRGSNEKLAKCHMGASFTNLAADHPHLTHRALRYLGEMQGTDCADVLLQPLAIEVGKSCNELVAIKRPEVAKLRRRCEPIAPKPFSACEAQLGHRPRSIQDAGVHPGRERTRPQFFDPCSKVVEPSPFVVAIDCVGNGLKPAGDPAEFRFLNAHRAQRGRIKSQQLSYIVQCLASGCLGSPEFTGKSCQFVGCLSDTNGPVWRDRKFCFINPPTPVDYSSRAIEIRPLAPPKSTQNGGAIGLLLPPVLAHLLDRRQAVNKCQPLGRGLRQSPAK